MFWRRKLEEPPRKNPCGTRIAVLTDGNNVSGMNLAIRALARLAINDGIEIVGIKGGFAGLAAGLGEHAAICPGACWS